jgi:hypothetical protein
MGGHDSQQIAVGQSPLDSSFASLGADRSFLSIGSVGSILSIGSAGSILSIGSAGSVASIGSAGSVASIFSCASILSAGSFMSIRGRGEFFSFPEDGAKLAVPVPPARFGAASAVIGAAVVVLVPALMARMSMRRGGLQADAAPALGRRWRKTPRQHPRSRRSRRIFRST